MSTHSNQARKGGPTSSRKAIRGANPTYKTSVQKNHESSETSKQEMGEGGMMHDADEKAAVGSGHYKANK